MESNKDIENADKYVSSLKEKENQIVQKHNRKIIDAFKSKIPSEFSINSLESLSDACAFNEKHFWTTAPVTVEIKNTYEQIQNRIFETYSSCFIEISKTKISLSDWSRMKATTKPFENKEVFKNLKQDIIEKDQEMAKKTKNRRKKGIIITAITLVGVLTVGTIAGVNIYKNAAAEAERNEKYESAITLLESGEYFDALSIFADLNGYKDSQTKAEVCRGLTFIKDTINYVDNFSIVEGIYLIVSAGEKIKVHYAPLPNQSDSDGRDQIIDEADFELFEPEIYHGYESIGWYVTEVFYDNMTHVTLDTNWYIKTYTVNYYTNGGINDNTNPSHFTIEDYIELKPAIRNGYKFLGWYDSYNNLIECINHLYNNLTLYAKWELI